MAYPWAIGSRTRENVAPHHPDLHLFRIPPFIISLTPPLTPFHSSFSSFMLGRTQIPSTVLNVPLTFPMKLSVLSRFVIMPYVFHVHVYLSAHL